MKLEFACEWQVVFTPGHGDGHHNHKLVLNVTDGSAHPEISCTAHSHYPHVDIEPHLLDVGASLPLAEGGAVLQGTLALHNPHNHAIEVGSALLMDMLSGVSRHQHRTPAEFNGPLDHL